MKTFPCDQPRSPLVRFALPAAAVLVSFAGFVAIATAAPKTCAGKCHKPIVRLPQVHSAIDGGDCTDCHQATQAKDARCKSGNTFTTEQEPALCRNCHDQVEGNQHPALEDGCLTCHNPHGGAKGTPNLREKSVAAQCGGCHDAFSKEKSNHKPVMEGSCTGCHNPHASKQPKLLKTASRELCFSCHERGKVLGGHEQSGSVHPPVGNGDCIACHQPHTSANPRLLRTAGNDGCLTCHGMEATNSAGNPPRIDLSGDHQHEAVASGSCTDCHHPHAAANEKLLRQARPALCQECHEPFSKPHKHGAVVMGRCNGCHEPHAGKLPKLLRREGADLCFNCHADDVTGRHSVHAPVQNGECLACHTPHDSDRRKLQARNSVLDTCMACHGKEGAATNKIDLEAATVHGAVRNYGCTRCHDPHGSNSGRLLIEDPPTLCTRCHDAQSDGRHVFSGFDSKPHPVSGPKDPARPDLPMSCSSCHDPHSSASPKLWREGKQKMELCKRCHANFTELVGNTEQPAQPEKPQE